MPPIRAALEVVVAVELVVDVVVATQPRRKPPVVQQPPPRATKDWAERHFAEGLGFWEVNVFRSLVYFNSGEWGKVGHVEFRQRLAHCLLTLGKLAWGELPQDEEEQCSACDDEDENRTCASWSVSRRIRGVQKREAPMWLLRCPRLLVLQYLLPGSLGHSVWDLQPIHQA